MRPPPHQVLLGRTPKIAPGFGTAHGVTPAPARLSIVPESKDHMLVQACQQYHQKRALPLLSVNRFRDHKDPPGDYSRHASRFRPEPRPKPKATPILDGTYL